MFERSPKNILVTGGAGFIGSAFIRYILSEGFQGNIINYDLLTYAGNLDNLKSVENHPSYFFCQGDIRNQSLVEHLCGEHAIDTIIHFAAETHVDRSISGPKSFMETNVMGTFSLLEAVRKFPHIHFHHVSTDEVYGCLGDTGAFTETSPYRPNSPYSASKSASDHLVRSYATTYGLSTCISNCSNNYGPYQYPEKLIPLMIQKCLEELPLPVYGDGKNVRDWLYVDDHAKALFMLLQHGKKGETYNIGGESEKTNLEVIQEITSLLSKPGLITFIKDRPGHDFRYAIDCTKIKTKIGWRPSHTFAEGMAKTVGWYSKDFQLRQQ